MDTTGNLKQTLATGLFAALGFICAISAGSFLHTNRAETVQSGIPKGVSPSSLRTDPLPVPQESKASTPPPTSYPAGYNFALAAHGATAEGGSNAALLIDGNDSSYNGGSGFATSAWGAKPPQAFIVRLKEPTVLTSIRFLLWDLDDRFYRYKLEVCPDEKGEKWKMIADRSLDNDLNRCHSWQPYTFEPQKVKLIRLTGTFNSANSEFHVVELQAFQTPPMNRDSLDF